MTVTDDMWIAQRHHKQKTKDIPNAATAAATAHRI